MKKIILVLLLGMQATLTHGTTVCGDVSGVWEVAGSPYNVNCDLNVPAGQTLEIQPGVEVLFTGHYKFNVFGNLQAIGTEEDSIVFTRAFPTEESRWGGLRFNSPTDSCDLQFCRIDWVHGTGAYPENGGAGVFVASSNSFRMANSTISDCLADDGGGGIYVRAGSSVFESCDIRNNTAINGGGGVFCHPGSTPEFISCNFYDNTSASNCGGGIAFFNSHGSLNRCLFVRNSAPSGLGCGGAIECWDSSPIITNCTIVDNAGVTGGGIYCFNSSPLVKNTIVWNNFPDSIQACPGSSISYSDIQGGHAGTGNIVADPLFVDEENGDFNLQAGSPCIDAGDPTSPLDPDGSRADMGAFASGSPPMCGSVNGTWRLSMSPIHVDCDITVLNGQSIVVNAGVEVIFRGPYSMTVNGSLSCEGTSDQPIIFRPDTSNGIMEWRGLRFRRAESVSTISHASFLKSSLPYSAPPDEGDYGGAIFIDSSAVQIENCRFEDNTATWGGAILARNALPGSRIDLCTFSNNRSVHVGNLGAGGAIAIWNTPVTMSYCLIDGNTARLGAAIEVTNTHGYFDNCTFVNNSAIVSGAIGYSWQGHHHYNNGIFSNNGSAAAFFLDGGSSTASVQYSDWNMMPVNFANIPAPAGFGSLSTVNINGDSVDIYGNLFGDPLFDVNEYNLLWNSPAIDAGDPLSDFDSDGSTADQGWKPFYQPTLIVLPDSLNFGTMHFGDDTTLQIIMVNSSPTPAPILDVVLSNSAFSVDSLPDRIAPGDTITQSVQFVPPMEGYYADTLSIVSKLAGPDVINIRLYASVPLVPSTVDSLVITRGALNGTQLYWAPVTTTTSGQPFTPSHYVVWGATESGGPYTPFGVSETASFHHPYIINSQGRYFYVVTASDESSTTFRDMIQEKR